MTTPGTIAGTLTLTAATPRPKCAAGQWIDNQTQTDQDSINNWIADGYSRNQLHHVLTGFGFKYGVSTLNNHLAGRCCCGPRR